MLALLFVFNALESSAIAQVTCPYLEQMKKNCGDHFQQTARAYGRSTAEGISGSSMRQSSAIESQTAVLGGAVSSCLDEMRKCEDSCRFDDTGEPVFSTEYCAPPTGSGLQPRSKYAAEKEKLNPCDKDTPTNQNMRQAQKGLNELADAARLTAAVLAATPAQDGLVAGAAASGPDRLALSAPRSPDQLALTAPRESDRLSAIAARDNDRPAETYRGRDQLDARAAEATRARATVRIPGLSEGRGETRPRMPADPPSTGTDRLSLGASPTDRVRLSAQSREDASGLPIPTTASPPTEEEEIHVLRQSVRDAQRSVAQTLEPAANRQWENSGSGLPTDAAATTTVREGGWGLFKTASAAYRKFCIDKKVCRD